jgi:phospholipid/cholesterol/gamma-HCH transport system permease protein
VAWKCKGVQSEDSDIVEVRQEDAVTKTKSAGCELSFSRPAEDTLLIRLAGSWRMGEELPSADEVQKELDSKPRVQRIVFDAEELTGWDSGLLTFLTKVIEQSSRNKIHAAKEGLPLGVQRLLALASAVPGKKDARKEIEHESFLSRVGRSTIDFVRSVSEMLAFIGEAFVALVKFLGGRAAYRRSDLFLIIQQCGAEALPIVSLISVLVGLILAFVGAVQLMMFGAQIYVASLVGIAMVRVMGAIMTGIIMAGRTGAAFAAELGTMQVNEEIDALHTLGISPMEFLVLPRMLALALMMPLLCLYSDLMGILGGLVVGVTMLDLNPVVYFNQTRAAVSLNHFWVGLFHSVVFGVLVALAGCLRGMQCGRSASAVGDAATSAVVTGIVSIIVATAIITVICNVIGI